LREATIDVPNPDIEGLREHHCEVIDHKVTWKLAQRPGSHGVLKSVRPVIKRHQEQTVSCPPAPKGVIEDCRADVNFCAGLLLDKFAWHLPFHRLCCRRRFGSQTRNRTPPRTGPSALRRKSGPSPRNTR